MRAVTAVALAVTVVALAVTAVAQAQAVVSTPAVQAAHVTIKTRETGAGQLLTNSGGHVLFTFSKDKRNHDACTTIKNCPTDWPPVTTSGKPVAGKGVKQSLLGTIPYKGKLREVTYGGHPLHTYKFDDGAANSWLFIGIKQFGGAWYALTPGDTVVK